MFWASTTYDQVLRYRCCHLISTFRKGGSREETVSNTGENIQDVGYFYLGAKIATRNRPVDYPVQSCVRRRNRRI